jgi:hypothetical protein
VPSSCTLSILMLALVLTQISRGGFTDSFGDDFLGLRELGIADEYGLSSLTIPKRLLSGKSKGESKLSSSTYVSHIPSHTPIHNCQKGQTRQSHHHHSRRRRHSYHSIRRRWKIKSVFSSLFINNVLLCSLPLLLQLFHHYHNLFSPMQLPPQLPSPYPVRLLSYYQTTYQILRMPRWDPSDRLSKVLPPPRQRRNLKGRMLPLGTVIRQCLRLSVYPALPSLHRKRRRSGALVVLGTRRR